jgi:restriction system protein
VWEKKLFHQGLKAFRVIRAADMATLELKARLQTEAWEERWRKIQTTEAKHRKQEEAARISFQRKELALQRTREAQQKIDALTGILADCIELDHVLDWNAMKQAFDLSEPAPQPPSPQAPPAPPVSGEARFTAKLDFLDRLIPSRRRRKIEDAQCRYSQARTEWETINKCIEQSNANQRAAYELKLQQWNKRKTEHRSAVDAMQTEYEAKTPEGLTGYWTQVLLLSEYAENFPKSFVLDYVSETQMLVIEYELPDVECLPHLKEMKYIAARDELKEVKVSDTWLNKAYDDVLYQICLRTIHEVFQSDRTEAVGSVVFNGWVNYTDKATGQQVTACILSLQVTKPEFLQLNLAQVDPKACFRSLKGVSGSKLATRSAVRPILQLNKEDKRFVSSHDVADQLDESCNLAAMDWLDFENLIREIFEKEFRSNGGEVKITRASRDGGVDAIAFDPDPIRGGKIVIQAKRYTNTVGVSAVRDLFGTVHNEGATKGILVTTSVYGPDAYEFAKGKPLTLLNGSELLYLLQKHGHRARIDLAEARRLAAERDPATLS